jgi:DHA1 family bicyclomycin/chloramphenicol resistance-like MFS transporter
MLAIVLMLGLHPTAMYLYLPTLPALQSTLGMSAAQVQSTLSAAIVSFGIGQIAWGPLADRHGRRPIMLAGVAMYTVASLGMIGTHALAVFMVCRIAQGLGVAAAGVACRAMLRDIYALRDRASQLSQAFSWLGVISLIGPPLGALSYEHAGLHTTLACMAVYGAISWMVIHVCVKETRPAMLAPTRAVTGMAYVTIFRNALFLRYTGLATASYIGHYLFLAGSSYALIVRLGMTPFHYGLVLASGSAVHMAGTFHCRHWLRRHDVQGTLARAAMLTLLGGLGMALLAACGLHAAWAIILPQCFYVYGHAIHQSCGQAAVNEGFPDRAASASALSGLLIAMPAAVLGLVLAPYMAHSDLPLGWSMAACGVCIASIAWWPRRARRARTMTISQHAVT